MKISKVTVQRGKTITLDGDDTENFEIQMDAIIEEKDDPQDIIQGLKSILDRHLLAWEQKIRGDDFTPEEPNVVTIKTAAELIEPEPVQKVKPKAPQISEPGEQKIEPLICPICNEQMLKKEGKDYYLCSKHWGYPDMIKAGNVKVKRF